MPTSVRYTVVDDEVIAEKRSGVRKEYVPDPLGSTVALLDNTQAQTDTFGFWPYGEVASRTGTTPTPYQHVGTLGYYTDNANRSYVDHRVLHKAHGRWMTQDPIGFEGGDWNFYRYVVNNPTNYVDIFGQWCMKVGADCIGSSCKGDPDCPPVNRPGHFTCNTGFNYGACGPLAYSTSPANPDDCISQACSWHDDCLADWTQFIIPFRRRYCDYVLCLAAGYCSIRGCDSSRNPSLCRTVANEVNLWMCNGPGTIPLPFPF